MNMKWKNKKKTIKRKKDEQKHGVGEDKDGQDE